MPSSVAPFTVDASTSGVNTRIDYRFATPSKSVKGSVVVEGKFTDDDIQALRENLERGALFVPRKLGIPDLFHLMPSSWDGSEEEHVIERISSSNAQADPDAPTFEQVVSLSDDFDLHAFNTENLAAAAL
jgi:hypothetical protein